MESNFLNTVLELTRADNWEELLHISDQFDTKITQKLLWAWPSEKNIIFFENIIKKYEKEGICSIGCGCGLLEWIIKKSTNIPIAGFEVNKEWWTSKYSNPQFISMKFVEMPIEDNLLNPNYALLFCYFNNGEAFIDYTKKYKGDTVIIIGPGDGSGHHTNPEPFTPNFFNNSVWKLTEFQEIRNSKDFIAVYRR